jgi:hypothetical protein
MYTYILKRNQKARLASERHLLALILVADFSRPVVFQFIHGFSDLIDETAVPFLVGVHVFWEKW